MTRNELALVTLLLGLVALTVFAVAGVAIHHLFAHLNLTTGGAQ